jgi:virulence-associated protein VagC
MSSKLSITRHGDVIVIAPARPSMKDLVAGLRAMPKPSSIEVREPIELPDRESGAEVSRSKVGWLQYNGRGRMR